MFKNRFAVGEPVFCTGVDDCFFSSARLIFAKAKKIKLTDMSMQEINPRNEVSQRLLEVMEILRRRGTVRFNKEIAERCDHSGQYITDLKSGKFSASSLFIARFCHSFDVNEDYIRHGRLPIFTWQRDTTPKLYTMEQLRTGEDTQEVFDAPSHGMWVKCVNDILAPRFKRGDYMAVSRVDVDGITASETYLVFTRSGAMSAGTLLAFGEREITLRPSADMLPQQISVSSIAAVYKVIGGYVFE